MIGTTLPTINSDIHWLQSGGFADVFVADGLVYKVFNKPLSERREFAVVKYLMNKYSQGHDMSHVAKYYGYGYAPKQQIFDIYSYCHHNGASSLNVNKLSYHFAHYDTIPFICMEYIPGMDGLDYGLRVGFISEDLAIEILLQLMIGIQQLHNADLIHRDMKPDNFIVHEDRVTGKIHVKIIDLGLATKAPKNYSEGNYETNIGTKQYMSPEALKGWHLRSSDIFAACKSIFILMGCPHYTEGDHRNEQSDDSNVDQSSSISLEFYRLLLRLTDELPSARGTVKQAITLLRDLQSHKQLMSQNQFHIPSHREETTLLVNIVDIIDNSVHDIREKSHDENVCIDINDCNISSGNQDSNACDSMNDVLIKEFNSMKHSSFYSEEEKSQGLFSPHDGKRKLSSHYENPSTDSNFDSSFANMESLGVLQKKRHTISETMKRCISFKDINHIV